MSSTNKHFSDSQIQQDKETMNSIKALVSGLVGLTAGLIIAALLIIY